MFAMFGLADIRIRRRIWGCATTHDTSQQNMSSLELSVAGIRRTEGNQENYLSAGFGQGDPVNDVQETVGWQLTTSDIQPS